MRSAGLIGLVFVLLAVTVDAQVSNFVYPIDPFTSYGSCTGGFAPISHHIYFDGCDNGNEECPSQSPQPLFGFHVGEDWNGYLSNGESCGNGDIGVTIRAIGNGTIVYTNNNVPGKGKVLIIKHTLPDDAMTVLYSSYFHLNSILQTSGSVYAGKPVATLGNTGGVAAHLHWEVVHNSSTSQGVNPWHDICTVMSPDGETNYQSTQGHCKEDSNVARPFLTGTNAVRYMATSLLAESRMYGVTIALQSAGGATTFSVSAKAPGSLVHIFNIQGQRKSVNNAVAAGWISYGLLWYDPSDGYWHYYYDANDLVMVPGVTYAIFQDQSNLGLDVSYPSTDQDSMQDLARMDMAEAAHVAGFKYIDPDAMVLNSSYAPNDPDYTFYSIPMTKTTNASKGDSNFSHWVLYAQNNAEPWVMRFTNIWDSDTGSWSGWSWRGNTLP